jgi:hypothetical protein
MISRNSAWREAYRKRPYARALSRAELGKRIRDIFLNMLSITKNGQLGFLPPKRGDEVWIEKFTHMLEEMEMRYGPYPNGMDRDILHSEPLPDFASELGRKAAERLSERGLRRNEVLIKYGQRKYMEELHRSGRLRIQAASFFSSATHNAAIRDDELSFEMSIVLSRDEVVGVVQNPSDVPQDAADQRANLSLRSPTDYWLYCLTKSINPRLFLDFSADSCVIIRNPPLFRQRLQNSAQKIFQNVDAKEGPANYIDPLFPEESIPFIPLVKHFGYTYQAEYRFIWLPRTPIAKLEHVDIEIGSLTDIAELIFLE